MNKLVPTPTHFPTALELASVTAAASCLPCSDLIGLTLARVELDAKTREHSCTALG
jgi:hypothetical protein